MVSCPTVRGPLHLRTLEKRQEEEDATKGSWHRYSEQGRY